MVFSCSSDDDKTNVSNGDDYIESNLNLITSFKLNINNVLESGIINQDSGIISFDLVGAELNSLVPIIEYSEKATLSPSESTSQNFNSDITYTVIAENGDNKNYQVVTQNRSLGEESKILSFKVNFSGQLIEAEIDEVNKQIYFNSGDYDISLISPIIEISDYASILPSSQTSQDFNSPIEYTVTAENDTESTYTITANKPSINAVWPTFSNNNYLYFVGAELSITGSYINPEANGAELLLINGTEEYSLEISSFSSAILSNGSKNYVLKTTLPENIPTFNNYSLIYMNDNYFVEFAYGIDIESQGPKNMTLSQTSYSYNDIFIIYGENLVPGLVVPSNGNLFIVENSNNYDISVNQDKTQLNWTLNYYQHFPSYYGNGPQLKKIYLIGNNRRVGEYVDITFN